LGVGVRVGVGVKVKVRVRVKVRVGVRAGARAGARVGARARARARVRAGAGVGANLALRDEVVLLRVDELPEQRRAEGAHRHDLAEAGEADALVVEGEQVVVVTPGLRGPCDQGRGTSGRRATARHWEALGTAARAVADDEDRQGARVDCLDRHEARREGAAPHERKGGRAQVLRKLAKRDLPYRVVDPIGVDLDPAPEHFVVGHHCVYRLACTERDGLQLVSRARAVLYGPGEVGPGLDRA